ncbi:uncharacterized protein LOC128239268 [Mya arenaria]|uniref:uncharacterized protein LOC128239268 n=1 Tax=Mya arenaria TaxID=6604 RepID=UPI0022E18C36|nr:uncharacterized protein LOC128239268 [Mya arenaria]
MAFNPLQNFILTVVLSLKSVDKISSVIILLTPPDLETLNNFIPNGLTYGQNTSCVRFDEVQKEFLKIVKSVKVFVLTLFKEDLSFGCFYNLFKYKLTIYFGNTESKHLLKQFLISLKTPEIFVTQNINSTTFQGETTAEHRIELRTTFQIDSYTPQITFYPPSDSIPEHTIANNWSPESTNDEPRDTKTSSNSSTATSIVIIEFKSSENNIAVNSGKTNEDNTEINIEFIAQRLTDKVQELVRSFTDVSLPYDEIRDALMEANRSNGYVVRSGNNFSSDSVYRERVTRWRMRVEITVEMFGRALQHCEGYDYVLTHTNIFPHNIRMFLHLPVLRGCSIHLSDCKHGWNF